ncbi:uncharacterized protein LOC114316741 [Camellia sinensis]|uniref:uncharacterized protein LOC114316741 n=1 Tax=Camellia sinensis TaxID=4442 RepID=UPI001035F4F5|nr:uncharacterized protein LOC114316741 [Camellia sinensis]
MANNKGFDGKGDLIEAYVALQHIVSSMNYICGVHIVILHAARERNGHAFMRLCGLIKTRGVSDLKYVVLKEKVAMFLIMLGHHHKNRNVKFNFMRPGQTNCRSALDGTYVRVLAPVVDKARYRSRKGEIATNVLGSYYLVDVGYTNGEGFLAPYRGQRYHLSTWREGGAPTNAEEFFNMKHSAARNIIERCFGLLKLRWAILRTYSYFPIKTQCRIITACCLLHNLIKREMPMDPLEVDLDDTLPNNQETGDEYIDTIGRSDQWSNWRDTLANQMYNEWLANRM